MKRTVLSAWIWPPDVTVEPLSGGLINGTWLVRSGGHPFVVLQCLNTDIFDPVVHEDIEAVTAHLAAKGIVTPRLVPTASGPLWHTEPDGSVWRVLTLVGDDSFDTLPGPELARTAGQLVGRFHAATADLNHRFRSVRPGAHDTGQHMATLDVALEAHSHHRLHDQVAPLADTLRTAWSRWSGPTDLPQRVIHGDLKISNLRFSGSEAVALIDLDTLAIGTLDIELGDAMRSWCNPGGEDQHDARFDIGLFRAAMEGYGATAPWTADERLAIGPGIERICLELSARFAADALNESYFGFDPARGRGEHNLLRAHGQATLAASVRAQRSAIEAAVAD